MTGLPVIVDPYHLTSCRNSACERLVPKGTLFCCGPCDHASGEYEIHDHSAGCDERAALRPNLDARPHD